MQCHDCNKGSNPVVPRRRSGRGGTATIKRSGLIRGRRTLVLSNKLFHHFRSDGQLDDICNAPGVQRDNAQGAMLIVMRALLGRLMVRRRFGALVFGVVVMAAPRLTSRGRFGLFDRKMRMVLQPVGRRVEAPDGKLSQRQQDSENPHRSRKHQDCQECHVCRTNQYCGTYAMLGDIVCFRNRFSPGLPAGRK